MRLSSFNSIEGRQLKQTSVKALQYFGNLKHIAHQHKVWANLYIMKSFITIAVGVDYKVFLRMLKIYVLIMTNTHGS